MKALIKKFDDIRISDVQIVGGKNASLGEMVTALASKGIKVPDGFATTADAFWYFINSNQLKERLEQLLTTLDKQNFSNLNEVGKNARQLILSGNMPADLSMAIVTAYKELCVADFFEVAVRSSATAEDLPNASFAGQHESFLNIAANSSACITLLGISAIT